MSIKKTALQNRQFTSESLKSQSRVSAGVSRQSFSDRKNIHEAAFGLDLKEPEQQPPSKRALSPESIIREENRKMLLRIQAMEKDGTKAEFTYDHEGRILLVQKKVPPKPVGQR